MKKVLINGVVTTLTDEEFEEQYAIPDNDVPTAPPLEKRVAALESALVDLALNNLEVVNNA